VEAVIAALDRRWSRWPAVVMIGLTLLALGLRLHDLGRWDLTFDEAASIWIARKPPPEMVRYLLGAFHEHPPFYYLSLWAWTQAAGLSEFTLRFWTVLPGVLSVPLIYIWLRRLSGRGVGLLAAFLLALSPLHVYYSQDARMYALIGALALLSLIFFDRILVDGQRRWWIGWGAVTLIGLATHYFMGLVNAAETVYLLVAWRQNRRALKPWLAIHIGVAALIGLWILASPGLQTTLVNMFSVSGRFEPLAKTLQGLTSDLMFGPVSRLDPTWRAVLGLVPAAGIIAGLVSRRRGAWLIGSLLVAPPLLVLLTPEALAVRYVLFIVFGYLAAIALALTWLAGRIPVAGLAVAGLVVWAGASRLPHQYATPKSVYGEVIHSLRSNWQPGDTLVLNGPWQWVQLDYYRPGDVPMFWLPPQTPPALDPAQSRPVLESIARDYRRVWVVQAAVKIADPDAFVLRWLNEHAFPADRRGDWLLYYTRIDSPRRQPLGVDLGDALHLREVRLPQRPAQSGEALPVEMHWSVKRAPGVDLAASLVLIDAHGATWAERVYQPGELFAPAATWAAGQDVVDRQALRIPIGTPPGGYQLRLNVRRADSGSALTPAGGGGEPWIALGQVEIGSADLARAAALPGQPQDAVFDGRLRLNGAALVSDLFSQGGWISFDLYWSAEAALSDGLSAHVALIDGDGRAVAEARQPVAPDWYAASKWPIGQIVRSRHAIQVPPRAPAGRYTLRVGVTATDGRAWEVTGRVRYAGLFGLWSNEALKRAADWPVAEVVVEEIPRQFALPSPQHRLDARFGDRFRLLGYDLQAGPAHAGETLRLTVYWQALQPIETDFTTFAHLVAPDGALVGQNDHWPRNWTYPTSFWVSGEVVVDEYTVPIDAAAAPGKYDLLVGWYDGNGIRLAGIDGREQPLPNNVLSLAMVEIAGP
jgi:4-amino-4-deoxy-L-arabinose transferase-like glycosyltransferase